MGKKKFRKTKIVGHWQDRDGVSVALDERGYYRLRNGKLLHREIYRLAYEAAPEFWVVHHIDCDKLNNEPLNLIALPADLHDQIHAQMRSEKRTLSRAEVKEKLRDYLYWNEIGRRRLEDEMDELEQKYGAQIKRFLFLKSELSRNRIPYEDAKAGVGHLERLDYEPDDVKLDQFFGRSEKYREQTAAKEKKDLEDVLARIKARR